jgi:hypothetical protein
VEYPRERTLSIQNMVDIWHTHVELAMAWSVSTANTLAQMSWQAQSKASEKIGTLAVLQQRKERTGKDVHAPHIRLQGGPGWGSHTLQGHHLVQKPARTEAPTDNSQHPTHDTGTQGLTWVRYKQKPALLQWVLLGLEQLAVHHACSKGGVS